MLEIRQRRKLAIAKRFALHENEKNDFCFAKKYVIDILNLLCDRV